MSNLPDSAWIQSLRTPPKPQSRTRTQRSAAVRISTGSTRPIPPAKPSFPRSPLNPTPAAGQPRPPVSFQPVLQCPNLCCARSLHSLPKFPLSKASYLPKLRDNIYKNDRERIRRAEAQRALYLDVIDRLNSCILTAIATPHSSFPKTPGCHQPCCDPSVHLLRSSREWARYKSNVKDFELRLKEVEAFLTVAKSFASPVRKLPPELLTLVFRTVVSAPNAPVTFNQPIPATEVLAHVCSYWRHLALADGRLWSVVKMDTRWQLRPHLARAQFYLEQSGSQALDIRVYDAAVDEKLLSAFGQAIDRWKYLVLKVNNSSLNTLSNLVRGRIPHLASLTLMKNEASRDPVLVDGFAVAPSLRRVVIGAQAHIWPALMTLPWNQLTCLILNPITLNTFAEIIHNCTQLLFFDARVSMGLEDVDPSLLSPHIPDAGATALRRPLRTLILRGSFCQDVLFLALLPTPPRPLFVFPQLRVLTLEITGGPHPCLYAALGRCLRLEMFAIGGWSSAEMEDVLSFVLAMPALRIMHFRDHKTVMTTKAFCEQEVRPQEVLAESEDEDDAEGDVVLEVEPEWKSLAELGVERFESCNVEVLYDSLAGRGSIEACRLRPRELEYELEHLFYR